MHISLNQGSLLHVQTSYVSCCFLQDYKGTLQLQT